MQGRHRHSGRRGRILPVVLSVLLLLILQVTDWWLIGPRTTASRKSADALGGNAYIPLENKGLKEALQSLYRRGRKQAAYEPAIPPPPPLREEAPTYDPVAERPKRKNRLSTHIPSTSSPIPEIVVGGTKGPAKGGDAGGASRSNTREPMSTQAVGGGIDFLEALGTFYDNLQLTDVKGNPEQPSKSFVDIDEDSGRGVALPYDPAFVESPENWQACDAQNASFSDDRDMLCQRYISNINNMRFIKAMPSRLLQGRTIKMKVFYAHNDLQAIVKISQKKFFYEAASEFIAFTFDRALQFNRVPTTSFVPMPLDYLRAATSYSPLLSQWFHRFVVLYNYTNTKFQNCTYHNSSRRHEIVDDDNGRVLCSMVATQLWMKDVNPALETFLGLPYEYDDNFANKYYTPGHELFSGTKRPRLRAIGELLDRFIFDFIIGNTDRGMNDHNNFVYGGCSKNTECRVAAPHNRIKGLAKYAFIDHGSSLHSHKEPQDNPFFGDSSRIKVCRFRKSTHEKLKRFVSRPMANFPLFTYVDQRLPTTIYEVAYESVLKKTQARLDKVVGVIDRCLGQYPEEDVYSLPEYNKIRIAEEDETLEEDWLE